MAKKNVYDVDLLDVVKTRNGRNVLMNLIERAGYFDVPIDERCAGMRTVAVNLVKDLERSAPDYWLMMLKNRLDAMNVETNPREEDEYDD